MRPVVSDAGPLHYMILIEAAECLAEVFGSLLNPEVVAAELTHPATPAAVRDWISAAPAWLHRGPDVAIPRLSTSARNAGERAAIDLARSVNARLLLIDDRAGDASARAYGLETTGTLGVLIRAAHLDLIDLNSAVSSLRATTFRCRPDLLDAIVTRYAPQK